MILSPATQPVQWIIYRADPTTRIEDGVAIYSFLADGKNELPPDWSQHLAPGHYAWFAKIPFEIDPPTPAEAVQAARVADPLWLKASLAGNFPTMNLDKRRPGKGSIVHVLRVVHEEPAVLIVDQWGHLQWVTMESVIVTAELNG